MEVDRFRAGSGEPLLLLHGIWESWHSWSPVLDRLAAEREVLALTLPDHLGSPPLDAGAAPTVETWADAVETELDAAGFERPDIAGNSLGGWLALELASAGEREPSSGWPPPGCSRATNGAPSRRGFAATTARSGCSCRSRGGWLAPVGEDVC